jgi:hypothetical protein
VRIANDIISSHKCCYLPVSLKQRKAIMAQKTFCAAMIDSETGGNETYTFDAPSNLLDLPATDVVDAFIKHLDSEGSYPSPMTYHLDHAINKNTKKIVLATGSLILGAGEIPFLLMISPQNRDNAD